MSAQQPLELILARNLLSSICTPALLLGGDGMLLFYNDAAASLLGRWLEESANRSAREWTQSLWPLDDSARRAECERLHAVRAVREQRPYHGSLLVRAADGVLREMQASAIPIVGLGGAGGTILFLWAPERTRGGALQARAGDGVRRLRR